MRLQPGNFVSIEQHIDAPPETVGSYIGDFRNAKEWMVGVEGVEQLGENSYRLTLDSPIGKLEPEAKVVEHGPHSIRWIYTSTIEGGGRVDVSPDRAARMVGVERVARRNGERSLARLKHLMEARR